MRIGADEGAGGATNARGRAGVSSSGLLVAVTVLGVAACNGSDLPSVLVVKAGRMSYFARSSLSSCTDLGARLADVERELSAVLPNDVHAVTYYKFDDADDLRRNAPCRTDGPSRSCTVGNEVFSAAYLNQHEVVHAIISRSGSAPPLIEEGLAEAIKCGSSDLASGGIVPPSWREAAAVSPYDSELPYIVGRRIVQWTWETFGALELVQYYRDSVSTLDPESVDAQYRRRFGMSLDQVWNETWIWDAVPHERHVTSTCPCVGEDLLVRGFGVTETACTTLFRSLPPPAGQIVRLQSFSKSLRIVDCNGREPPVDIDVSSSAARDVLLQLSDVRHYLEVPPRTSLEGVHVDTGAWLNGDCASADPLEIGAPSAPTMTWILERANRWQHLAFANSTTEILTARARESLTGMLGEWQICDSCSSCRDVDVSEGIALAPGTTSVRVRADSAPPTTPPHVLYRVIEWEFAR